MTAPDPALLGDKPVNRMPAQIALAWLLARYERMLLIPGTTSVAHPEENMAAIEIELDAADLAVLDRVGQRGGGATLTVESTTGTPNVFTVLTVETALR